MAENNVEAFGGRENCDFKEAVCINAGRIYDSCSDKDCLEDLRVYFTDATQPIIDNSYSVKIRRVEVLNVFMDVEPVPFNKGFFSVDMTFFFQVSLDAYTSPISAPTTVCGLSTFCKKVILYGSEGSVKVFTNDQNCDFNSSGPKALPKANVQVAEPMVLACKMMECPEVNLDCCCLAVPNGIAQNYEGNFDGCNPEKIVEITLGIFTIVQLERQVQMLVPCYDFCIPDKECISTSDNPCELFSKVQFPVDEFFPPRLDNGDDCHCGC